MNCNNNAFNRKFLYKIIYVGACAKIYFLAMDNLNINLNLIYLLIAAIAFVSIIINRKYIEINKYKLLWLISLMFMFITCINSINIHHSLQYIYLYAQALIIFIFLTINTRYNIKNIKIHKLFLGICLFFSLLEYFFPDIYFDVIKNFFTDESVIRINNYLIQGRYVGLNLFPGLNAFFMAVGMGISIVSIWNKKEKKIASLIINIILFILYMIAILLTTSRAMLLASSISLLILVTIYTHTNIKKRIKAIYVLGITLFIMIIIAMKFIPDMLNVFGRMTDKTTIDNRLILYNFALDLFNEKPLLGQGINTFVGLTFMNSEMIEKTFAHNVVIQLLAETGLIGTIAIILPFVCTLIITIKKVFKAKVLLGKGEIVDSLMSALYVQIIFLLYFISGNPIYDYNLLLMYFLFISIPIGIKIEKE